MVSTGDYWKSFPTVEKSADDQPLSEDNGEKLKLDIDGYQPPRPVTKNLGKFLRHYQRQKTSRTLHFKQEMGLVQLTLEFDNCST